MNEAAHTTSLISQSKSSSSFDNSDSDPTSFILNERETRFAKGMERHRSDLSRSIRPHQEIFEPQTEFWLFSKLRTENSLFML